MLGTPDGDADVPGKPDLFAVVSSNSRGDAPWSALAHLPELIHALREAVEEGNSQAHCRIVKGRRQTRLRQLMSRSIGIPAPQVPPKNAVPGIVIPRSLLGLLALVPGIVYVMVCTFLIHARRSGRPLATSGCRSMPWCPAIGRWYAFTLGGSLTRPMSAIWCRGAILAHGG